MERASDNTSDNTREIIRDRAIVRDTWHHIPDAQSLPEGIDATVSLPRWLADRCELSRRQGRLGLRLGPSEDPNAAADGLAEFGLIVVEFPKFTDGRGYTIARLLRERLGYRGELRAVGNVLRDQLYYLHRVGFNAFELAPGKSPRDALEALDEFSVTYQSVGVT